MKKVENHTFAGLQRDVSVSKHPVTFLYDAKNIRLTARNEKNTLLSVTNEKGTSGTDIVLNGTYLGHCLLNKYLVVFTADKISDSNADYIYRIDLSDPTYRQAQDNIPDNPYILFQGNLNFDIGHPIDAVGSFESEQIQKVYWTDNYNQPRMINIIHDGSHEIEDYGDDHLYTKFDFVRTLSLQEVVKVRKILDSSGEFPAGVIQYAFTYFDNHGQESNIFYTTPLLYVSPADRGGRPDEKVSNSFEISIDNVDPDFDFLRIYSIQRTSLNGTPICKRVQDMNIREMDEMDRTYFKKMVYVDNGFNGDTIDPTELLYKGGEEITAETIEQKDGTLFLGGVTVKRETLHSKMITVNNTKKAFDVAIKQDTSNNFRDYFRALVGTKVSDAPYKYDSQLTADQKLPVKSGNTWIKGSAEGRTVPCGGFKSGDVYRCGIQFQHKTGKWDDPIWLKDETISLRPFIDDEEDIQIRGIDLSIPSTYLSIAYAEGYRRVRPVVVFPEVQDRNVVCQGVLNPTLYTKNNADNNNPFRQSSWFFRPYRSSLNENSVWIAPNSGNSPSDDYLSYTQRNISNNIPTIRTDVFNPKYIRDVEIEGDFEQNNKFRIDKQYSTFHSPDVEFDDHLATMDFIGLSGKYIANAEFVSTISDIDIQTETPTISSVGSGFVHMPHTTIQDQNFHGPEGIVAGLFYDDFVFDDHIGEGNMGAAQGPKQSAKWLIYPWQGSGSLNNDINRPADKGTATAILKKKIISNLRYANTTLVNSSNLGDIQAKLFSSDAISILKINNKIYQGNVDTMLTPDNWDGKYLAFNGYAINGIEAASESGIYKNHTAEYTDTRTPFDSTVWFKTWSLNADKSKQPGLRKWCYNTRPIGEESEVSTWAWMGDEIGSMYVDSVIKKLSVRMKYKSSPHLVITNTTTGIFSSEGCLPIIDIVHTTNPSNRFGGDSEDALQANTWLPCGEPVIFDGKSSVAVHYIYGDTYYQRYDCLKTYPYTPEDLNQIVEIGSFMLETRINIDGRYDRNRGQSNNLNMTPKNFNLMNYVYSQKDNFFSYKILPEDYYNNNSFPNQITWTKEKQSGAEVDMWTNVTLASTYDMDGSKGAITSLNTWRDQLFCFQNKGVSNILFNSRVQIPASDGMPIEISNSYKVDGYRYLSDGIGCNDKRQIKETTSGIYFIDSVSGHLHHIGDGLRDVAAGSNMTTWFREHGKDTQRLFYDDINHDLYVIQEDTALCFSELLSQFTSFMDYGGTSLIESYNHRVFTMKGFTENSTPKLKLYAMFEGEYCNFFEENKPWGFTFVSNGSAEGMTDKVFTNLEFRACVDGDGTVETGKFLFNTPLDYIETWNEYQHGFANLEYRNGHAGFQHHSENGDATLKRKFRIWRCDIPRNNCLLDTDHTTYDETEGNTPLPYSYDSNLGISRHIRKPMDRMRNPWLFVKLQKNAAAPEEFLHRTELHDMVVTYFD